MSDRFRILITGAPRSGKSSLAEALARAHRCLPMSTDNTDWSLGFEARAIEIANNWFPKYNFIIEGVLVPAALRYFHQRFPNTPPPCDELIVLPVPSGFTRPGRKRMASALYRELDDLLATWPELKLKLKEPLL